MNISRNFNALMASAISFSLATTPMMGVGVAHAQNAPAAEAPGDAGWQKEFEVWRSASKAGTAAGYEAYLKTYPTGKFASVAKKRIDDLNGTVTANTAKIDKQQTADTAGADTTAVRSADADTDKIRDLEMWRQVSKTGKQADYEKYLKAFPKGKFAKVAKTRIDSLTAAATAPADQQTAQADKTPVQQDDQAQADDQQNQAADSTQVTEQAAQDDQQDQASSQNNAQQDDQAQAPASDWEQEYALWKAASDGNTVTEYEAYLKSYPKGKFSAIAQARIVQLAAAEQPVANVDEGDTAQTEQDSKVKQTQDQADQGHMNQPDDDQGQMAGNQADDQSQQNDMGQNTQDQNAQDQQKIQYSEGTPETEDQFLNREGRHEMQGRLTSLGYDTFGSDGSFGPNTRTAISNWQQDNGAPVSGYLAGDQISQIRKLSQVSYAQWMAANPVVVRQPIIVRPRREKIIVEERANPGLDAAIAVGVLGAVLGAQRFGRVGKFGRNRPGRVKMIGKFNMFGGCKKKRRC